MGSESPVEGFEDQDIDAQEEMTSDFSDEDGAAADGDADADLDAEPASSDGEDADGEDGDGASSSGGGGSSDDDEDSDGPQQHGVGFLSGGKAASFAKAFAKIMGDPGLAPSNTAAADTDDEAGAGPSSLAAAAATALAGASGDVGDVILSESASLRKRKAEVAQEAAARKEIKLQKLELKKRGHMPVPRKGEDPVHDAHEKQLQRLATRGVVLLFNAINKAQKAAADAEAARRKGPKISKAGLLAELKAGSAGLNSNSPAMGLVPPGKALYQQQAGQQQQREEEEEGGGGAQWEVLGSGFPGLTGGSKMKDWDKQVEVDEDLMEQQVAGSEEEDDVDDGW